MLLFCFYVVFFMTSQFYLAVLELAVAFMALCLMLRKVKEEA